MKGSQWESYAAEEHRKNQARRTRVLAHPDLAQRLCDRPYSLPTPEMWTGYVPPDLWRERHNDSPIRAQIIAVMNAVKAREDETVPIAPELITAKQEPLLAICLSEYGITDPSEQLMWLTSFLGRDITSSSELHKDEASAAIDRLTALVRQEQEATDETSIAREDLGLGDRPGDHQRAGDGGGAGPEDPPY